MRLPIFLIGILISGHLYCQNPAPNELYRKIVEYYQQNSDRLEYVIRKHKNVFRYDTATSSFIYLPIGQKGFYLFNIDSNYIVTGGVLLSDDYYIVNHNSPEKILLKKREHKGSMLSNLHYVTSVKCNSLFKILSKFGVIKSIDLTKDKYVITTQKSILEVDASTFRIMKYSEKVKYKKEYHQYDEFYYPELSDSTQRFIKEQVITLTEAARDYSVVTFKELGKRNPPKEDFEGKLFEFKNFVSLNKGMIDSSMKGKYIILDFFYLSCLPCHKMTGYILDWLPSVDSSKILLIGVNPADSEYNMKMEIKTRKIDYPVIIGEKAREIAQRYGIHSYPTLFLLSPDGTIQQIHEGMSKSFLTKVEKIMSGNL